MDLERFLEIIRRIPNRQNFELTTDQQQILQQRNGPLWVIAGPGSGKTEILVLRCLCLIYVDRIDPRSIFVTTFTEKAARELEDRISDYSSWISQNVPPSEIEEIDVTHVRVGTLHSLCNEILQEYRYPSYQNVRLMDELEQLMFTSEHSELVRHRPTSNSNEANLWRNFGGLLGGWANVPINRRMSAKLNRAIAFRALVGRIVEYQVDVERMHQQGGFWGILAEGYNDYVRKLSDLHRSDFSHVQATFLEFLGEPKGNLFLDGDGSTDHPGITHILVDEYQDTNPIQETIYFELTGREPHNLMVVGDDDQAIYRFRGGTVEALINFNNSCANAWNIDINSIQPIQLYDNFRSHRCIVEWCNHYITSFPIMRQTGARAPGKRPLEARSEINRLQGDYPSIGVITGPHTRDVARVFALVIRELLDEGIVTDPSDCALLMRSTRETRTWAGPYVQALRNQGVEVYNPRAKTFMDQEEVRSALGTFLAVVDPALGGCPSPLRRIANQWRDAYQQVSVSSQELSDYVERAAAQIASKGPITRLNTGAMELFYLLLAFPPFSQWQDDLERSLRLAKLTRILEAYTAMPQPDAPDRTRNWLSTSSQGYEISYRWRQSFYWGLVAILEREGLNDEEDEYIIFPPGRLPIMTIFQAKGLQFPFVFVATTQSDSPQPSGAHEAEDLLYPFRINAIPQRFQAPQRAIQDFARLFYVAHSRAQYGLIILTTDGQLQAEAPHLGPDANEWFRGHDVPNLTLLPVRQ